MSDANRGDPWSQHDAAPTDWVSPDTPQTTSATITASAPVGLLGLAGGSVVVGGVLLVFARSNPAASLLAWLLGGPVTLIVLGLYLKADAERRSHAVIYHSPGWTRALYTGIAVSGLIVAGFAAWFFADWVGRR